MLHIGPLSLGQEVRLSSNCEVPNLNDKNTKEAKELNKNAKQSSD